MQATEWARLKDWFGAAIESPDRVDSILREAHQESPGLAAELRQLLREHESDRLDADAVLRATPVRVPQEAHPIDVAATGRFGPYRTLREVGRGGTGVVFLAERVDDEFHRPVALKVLRYVSWDSRSHDLLTAERRVLSQLQHPNIAALLDWGDTPEGSPWLATEFVQGLPIDEYCRTHDLTVPQILAVFAQVCEAVQYAHRRLVVHRDLKPANILVTDAGQVKLLDFGISKPPSDGEVTNTIERRFTPAYASPEQLKGEAVTAASDVYTLGLLLYELLCGAPPHATGSVEDLARRLQDRAFTPPSAAAGLPRARRRELRGDLDNIVLHALDREPERRYPSVEQLLADITSYRAGYPIAARRPGALYRAAKFVRRNALPVAGFALAIAALVGGTAAAVANARAARREQNVAERRFRDLQGLAHSVIFQLHDAIRDVPGSSEPRRLLITTAVKYLDALDAENIQDDALRMELAASFVRMAYVQGGAAGINIGDTEGGLRSYRTALRILDDQWARRADDERVGTLRFAAAYNLSMMINDPAEGIALARDYTAQADGWAARAPSPASWQASELMHYALGRTLRTAGAIDEALVHYDVAADLQRRIISDLSQQSPRLPANSSVDLGQALFDSGMTSYARTEALLDMGRAGEALETVQATAILFQRAARRDPENRPSPSVRRMSALTRTMWALSLAELGRLDEALVHARAGLEGTRINRADDASATHRRDLAQAHRHLGNLLCASNDVAPCLDHLKEATNTIGKLTELDPVFLTNRQLLAAMLNDYGNALLLAGRAPEAAPMFRRALDTADHALVEGPSLVALTRERARALSGLGRVEVMATPLDRDKARTLLEQGTATWQEFRRRTPLNQRHLDEQLIVERLLHTPPIERVTPGASKSRYRK